MVQTFFKEYKLWRDFRLPRSALATVVRKSFNGKFTAKNWFSDRAVYVNHSDADILSLKCLLTLFDKFLDHMLGKFEQNRMVQIMQNFVPFSDKKWLTFFDKVLTPFWKTKFLQRKQLYDAKILI